MTATPDRRTPDDSHNVTPGARTPDHRPPKARRGAARTGEPAAESRAAGPGTTAPRPPAPRSPEPAAPPSRSQQPPRSPRPRKSPSRDRDGDLDLELDIDLDLDAEFDLDAPPAGSGPADPAGGRSETRSVRDLPRWVRWLVLPLLVLVPAGYLAISADQSRDGGVNQDEEAATRQMTAGTPTALQQRIYQVAFPSGATGTAYLETNSWDTSVLYAQFTTTSGGLDAFLAGAGTSRPALREGRPDLPAAQARTAGWTFAGPGPWEGISLHRRGDKPDHDIVVDLSHPDAPVVYVVSTVNFQHGFGGG